MQSITSILTLVSFIFLSIQTQIVSLFPTSVQSDSATSAAGTYTDIPYGDFERNTMDIYLPDSSPSQKSFGAIMFIHGGSWTSGDKSSEASLCRKYAQMGYVTATINYHYIDFTHPVSTNMTDIELAIQKLSSFCKEKGYNVTKLALHGYSSGAHLATLFSYSCPERSAIPLAFVVNMAGPSDFHSDTWNEWHYDKNTGPGLAVLLYGPENLSEYFNGGNPDIAQIPQQQLEAIINTTSPVYYMNENSIPTICGYAGDGKDGIVPTKNKTLTDENLKKFKIEHDFFSFENSNHFLIGDASVRKALYEKVDEYCKTYFGY